MTSMRGPSPEASGHTPGPWRVIATSYASIACNGSFGYDLRGWDESVNMADLRLMAAAPELLAALRECADTLAIRAANGSVPRIDEPALIKAAEAIEKATQP